MEGEKIVRSLCYFSANPTTSVIDRLLELENILKQNGYQIQTKRLCSPAFRDSFQQTVVPHEKMDTDIIFSCGSISPHELDLDLFCQSKNMFFHLDLTGVQIEPKHAKVVLDIARRQPGHTFQFAYCFHTPPSSPYFPSGTYETDGFRQPLQPYFPKPNHQYHHSIGFQSPNLSRGCHTLDAWFRNMKSMWLEVNQLFHSESDFLGIDSSVAPAFDDAGSLVHFLDRLGISFTESVLSDTYLQISRFIARENPKPIGLCGLMLPCLEDFELAAKYDAGEFPLERNIFLSLHSGLGIDTYPIGIDERVEKVQSILQLVQGLSEKYHKPLSIRFVSDGTAKICETTNFRNQYLKDVTIRPL